ncbi:MAG TPA: molybdopterin-binding protein [Candidatus Limnocylindrales bacterium]
MRPLIRAELLSIGSELTVGETRDTNAGDLARELTARGVDVLRLSGLPDDLPAVRDAFGAALERADLVVSTGGLGPTPDDLTRESIAALVGETPAVDPELDRWLTGLFERRGLPFPDANRKQAWLIPSATAIPNDGGTAPGWWVDRPDGGVIVALPGPPREMRPMWREWVLPRLEARGLGRPTAVVTLRTSGLGESLIAEKLGSMLDRGANPTVATYARSDAVDVRISAVDGGERSGDELVSDAEARIVELIGDVVWGRGDATWPEAIGQALDARGWRLALVEVATRGAVTGLLAEGLGDGLAFAETLLERPAAHDGHDADLEHLAGRVRQLGPAEVGLAVEGRTRGQDMLASVAIVDPTGTHRERRVVFLAGAQGRSRVAIAAAAMLLARLRATADGPGR